MSTPATGDTVTIDYTLTRTDGQEVGSTAQVGPQQIELGTGQTFPQIEEALKDMRVGDSRTVAIPCADAFGPRREELVQELPRSELPPGPDPEPGMALQAQRPDGSPMMLHIAEVGPETITVDANHPLAGEDLSFAITLRAILSPA